MPVLPLLLNPESYRPCVQNLLTDGPEVQDYWLTLFERHLETLARLPLGNGQFDQHSVWPEFSRTYLAGLAAIRQRPDLRGRLTVLELTIYREEQFAAHGINDPFHDLKQRENELALGLFAAVLADVDAAAPDERIDLLAQGLFAGNLFDMGSRAVVEAFESGTFDFRSARQGLRPRPWPIDHLDAWKDRLAQGRYRRAIFFVDNAGPDILLGAIPMARELADRGIHVVLAANTRPALNDITAEELMSLLPRLMELDTKLTGLVRRELITVVETGCVAPLIDLADLSGTCCRAAEQSDLLVLEGMGRAIEINFDEAFKVDTLKLAMIKDRMVAEVIGVKLMDPIFRFDPAP